ncbi:MAG: TonB-dependent receptor [Acidobacteria bacterium]|nr:TonB-dependent receptor [Acidobacteriota bacterium]MCA1619914.1 TonB-dependent receptor [Acidobacteriota bacterium]
MRKLSAVVFCLLTFSQPAAAQSAGRRALSGVVVTASGEVVPGVAVVVTSAGVELRAVSDAEGAFRLSVPRGALTLNLSGENIAPAVREIAAGDSAGGLRLVIEYVVPPIHESIVIVDSSLDPGVERRNEEVYRGALFSRDDQLFDTLAAGINAGQHEGGGKSLEVRRFGFNMDHGGLFGGFKVLVDDVQQNFGTQGHGQGYLGQLKSLTPELVEGVEVLNGPFSAQYGDFSGLGVAHVRTRESLPDVMTARVQGGSFDTFRGFLAYSPVLKNGAGFIAYEASRTNGPFVSPLRYRRDNLTGNYTRNLGGKSALGFKLNLGRNDFSSSGQIPLDEVAAGRLDRFGFIDADNGGRVRGGTAAVYYRRELDGGGLLKADGFLTRSLFDLWSNFTFHLNDPEFGDEIQQHDSRLQEGTNVQYVRPHTLFGARALLTAGGNLQSFQTNVGLYPSAGRDPGRADLLRSVPSGCPFEDDPARPGLPDRFNSPCFLLTSARARVTNPGVYAQQAVDLFGGRLHLGGGLRYDYFRFNVEDLIRPAFSGARGEGRIQPKASLAYTPSHSFPATVHFNYGRGISSQDARGVARRPESPRVATTDFYQLGTSHNFGRFSASAHLFLIDNSNQQVYIPDDGSIEFAGPSRAYGFELKNSARITRRLSFNGGLTRVMNAFYRGTRPREYVDGAPHTVANAGLTLSDWRGFSGSLRYRHTSNYRLDPLDARIRAAGLDVVDLGVNKRLRRDLDFNLAVDNLFNRRYFETQNYFESRVRPGDEPSARIHATPGYPFGVTVGLTFRFNGK